MARNSWKNYASIGALAVAGGFSLSSFMNEQSDISTFDLPPEVSVMTIQEFRDGMTMAHFSKIRGIADRMSAMPRIFEKCAMVMPSRNS